MRPQTGFFWEGEGELKPLSKWVGASVNVNHYWGTLLSSYVTDISSVVIICSFFQGLITLFVHVAGIAETCSPFNRTQPCSIAGPSSPWRSPAWSQRPRWGCSPHGSPPPTSSGYISSSTSFLSTSSIRSSFPSLWQGQFRGSVQKVKQVSFMWDSLRCWSRGSPSRAKEKEKQAGWKPLQLQWSFPLWLSPKTQLLRFYKIPGKKKPLKKWSGFKKVANAHHIVERKLWKTKSTLMVHNKSWTS